MVTVGDHVNESLFVVAVVRRPAAFWALAIIKNATTPAAIAAVIIFGHPDIADDFLQRKTWLMDNQNFDIAITQTVPHVLQSFDQFIERHRLSHAHRWECVGVAEIRLAYGWNWRSVKGMWQAVVSCQLKN
jgi:hypothetical protein